MIITRKETCPDMQQAWQEGHLRQAGVVFRYAANKRETKGKC